MSGLRDQSAFETFDRMAGKIDQLEAEAEAASEIQEEFTGDSLTSQFAKLEQTSGADEDLLALKRKMGLAPPDAPPAPQAVVPTRVEAPAAESGAKGPSAGEQEELAAALEELEAEHQAEQRKMGR
jgi:phage shock protein A